MVHPPVGVVVVVAIMMIPTSNAIMMLHLPVRTNPTAAVAAILLLILGVMALDTMWDAPTALTTTGVVLHHQATMIATEEDLRVALLLPTETVTDRRSMVEVLLRTATVVTALMLLPVAAAVVVVVLLGHTVEVLIPTAGTVDPLPNLLVQAAAISHHLPVEGTIPVDPRTVPR